GCRTKEERGRKPNRGFAHDLPCGHSQLFPGATDGRSYDAWIAGEPPSRFVPTATIGRAACSVASRSASGHLLPRSIRRRLHHSSKADDRDGRWFGGGDDEA